MSSEYIEIHWTCASFDEAEKASFALVKEELVACAQIIPELQSIYRWKGSIERAKECKIIFKTRRDLFEKVKKRLQMLTSYEVPEIIALPIEEGSSSYLSWISDSTTAGAGLTP